MGGMLGNKAPFTAKNFDSEQCSSLEENYPRSAKPTVGFEPNWNQYVLSIIVVMDLINGYIIVYFCSLYMQLTHNAAQMTRIFYFVASSKKYRRYKPANVSSTVG